MNIISIGLDKNLFDPTSSVVRRQKLYCKAFGGENNIIVHTGKSFKKVTYEGITVYPSNSFLKPFFILDAFFLAKKILKKEKIDLIVTQDPHICGLIGLIIKLFYKIPLCVHFHADFLDNKYWVKEFWLNRLFNFISKVVIKKADGFRVVSKKIKEDLIRRGFEELHILHQSTPINLDYFGKIPQINKIEFKKRHQIKENKIVLFVGRLTAQKNLEFLIRCFSTFEKNDAVLLIVGEGELNKRLHELINHLGAAHIRLLGNMNISELKEIYYSSDILVLPSLYEGTAKVIKEAAVCGLPMILTDISGTRDFLDDTCARIIPVNDAVKLQDSIQEMIGNEEIGKVYSSNAKRNIAELSEDKGIKIITEFWRKISKK